MGDIILSPVTCIVWLVVGAAAGGLAHQFVGRGRSGGLVPDIVLGLIGAVVGGIVLSWFGGRVNGNILNPLACIGHLFVATLGASILIVVGRTLSGRS
jgi:uncharacterized membrane protein YeaQ/YmgE (transglycosylase-associated protein family)